MIEVIIKQYLDNHLEVPVFFEFEDVMPLSFVVVEKIGSTKADHLKSATFAFQSYAASLYEAAALNELVKDAVENMIILNEVSGVRLNADYNFTDVETKRYRYQAVFDIYHY